ncbi:phosphatase PAP2 family protein [Streptomyces anandii]|uniref:phosphatase PAP2 family protein n=1 Tax=Streptomyces anandii TaxID=285454 RepID=UPI0036B0A6BF
MTTSSPTVQALDGAAIDGGLYTEVTDFARHTQWLNGPVSAFTSYGIGLFAVFLLVAWWRARREGSAATMATVLCAPFAVVVAYIANSGIKSYFEEPRPCRALPHDFLIEACPPMDDYAFPSNHTTVAFAFTVALLLVSRRLGSVALLTAVAMGASRVYVGAHYPHDVAVGAVVGSVVALLVVLGGRGVALTLVERLGGGPLAPLLTVPARGAHAAHAANASRPQQTPLGHDVQGGQGGQDGQDGQVAVDGHGGGFGGYVNGHGDGYGDGFGGYGGPAEPPRHPQAAEPAGPGAYAPAEAPQQQWHPQPGQQPPYSQHQQPYQQQYPQAPGYGTPQSRPARQG